MTKFLKTQQGYLYLIGIIITLVIYSYQKDNKTQDNRIDIVEKKVDAVKEITQETYSLLKYKNEKDEDREKINSSEHKVIYKAFNLISKKFKLNLYSLNPIESTKEQYQIFNDSIYEKLYGRDANAYYNCKVNTKINYDSLSKSKLPEIKVVNKYGVNQTLVRTVDGKINLNNN